MLLVRPDEGGEDAVLLVQQSLGPVVLQDDPALHHNHQVGIQDGVDAMLQRARTFTAPTVSHRRTLSTVHHVREYDPETPFLLHFSETHRLRSLLKKIDFCDVTKGTNSPPKV